MITMQDILQDDINARTLDTELQGMKVSLKDTLESLYWSLYVRELIFFRANFANSILQSSYLENT